MHRCCCYNPNVPLKLIWCLNVHIQMHILMFFYCRSVAILKSRIFPIHWLHFTTIFQKGPHQIDLKQFQRLLHQSCKSVFERWKLSLPSPDFRKDRKSTQRYINRLVLDGNIYTLDWVRRFVRKIRKKMEWKFQPHAQKFRENWRKWSLVLRNNEWATLCFLIN